MNCQKGFTSVFNFRNKLSKLDNAIRGAVKYSKEGKEQGKACTGLSLKSMYDFRAKKALYYTNAVESSLKELRVSLWKLSEEHGENESGIVELIMKFQHLEKAKSFPKKYENMGIIADEMKGISRSLKEKQCCRIIFQAPVLPGDLREEIHADITELQKCFNSKCYRSSIILCGRILEAVLHRKYYEVTGRDILEKQPGIGLGTLIAKLKEKGVVFDPAVTQQIHLINQVRIFSVHKKQQAFMPTRTQAHATILYTLDILRKMFEKA